MFVVIVAGLVVLFSRMPTGYLPDEDQGMLMGIIQLPVGSTLEQTEAVLAQIRRYFAENEQEAVESFMGVAGIGPAGRGQNQAMAYVKLRDWDLRRKPGLSAQGRRRPGDGGAVAHQGREHLRRAAARRSPNSATRPASTSCSRTAAGSATSGCRRRATSSSSMAARDPRLARVRPNGMPDVPQYKVDIDWERAGTLGVPVNAIQSYLSAAFGSSYVNDFVQGGRVKRVYAQADAPFRMLPSDLAAPPRAQHQGRPRARSRRSPPAAGSTARRASSGTTPCRR